MADETLLVLSGDGVPPYSARGLSQTLDPIAAAQFLRRTANGVLKDLAHSQFRKYMSSISCNDQDPPAFDGLWPGMTLTVDCVQELGYKTAGGAADKTIVPGSTPRVEGAYTYYRPRLVMKVISFNQTRDEYGHLTNWTMTLEEI